MDHRPYVPVVTFLEPDCTLDGDLSRKSTSFSTHSEGTADLTFEVPLLESSSLAGADTALPLAPVALESFL
jgi:hypothetical protein